MRIIKQVLAKTVEFGGEQPSGWLPMTSAAPLPTPLQHTVVDVRIFETDGGFILEWKFRDTNDGNDSLHQTIEEAETEAAHRFAIEASDWEVSGDSRNRTIDEAKIESYNDSHIAAYPVEYIAGIDLYNAGEFHAAHDVWEERWMGEVGPQEKLFLQAMIQSAVAFHHLDIGRPGAARRMHQMAREKFARLGQSVFMSLDLEEYQKQLDQALLWLWDAADPRELVQPEIIPPKIRLLPQISDFD